MLFNEPKLLKFAGVARSGEDQSGFSALQRAEIAEIINRHWNDAISDGFSALQRAEIAEIVTADEQTPVPRVGFSALQRAEIAEIADAAPVRGLRALFQCSSTSRNC